MRKFAAALVATLLGLMPPHLDAAHNPDDPATFRMELLVVEVAGCTVCELIRERIQPAYEATPRARDVPMRYVDITNIDERKLGLTSRVETVPTIVLMRDGKEVDRISGYLGPANFFAVLNNMLDSVVD